MNEVVKDGKVLYYVSLALPIGNECWGLRRVLYNVWSLSKLSSNNVAPGMRLSDVENRAGRTDHCGATHGHVKRVHKPNRAGSKRSGRF